MVADCVSPDHDFVNKGWVMSLLTPAYSYTLRNLTMMRCASSEFCGKTESGSTPRRHTERSTNPTAVHWYEEQFLDLLVF